MQQCGLHATARPPPLRRGVRSLNLEFNVNRQSVQTDVLVRLLHVLCCPCAAARRGPRFWQRALLGTTGLQWDVSGQSASPIAPGVPAQQHRLHCPNHPPPPPPSACSLLPCGPDEPHLLLLIAYRPAWPSEKFRVQRNRRAVAEPPLEDWDQVLLDGNIQHIQPRHVA